MVVHGTLLLHEAVPLRMSIVVACHGRPCGRVRRGARGERCEVGACQPATAVANVKWCAGVVRFANRSHSIGRPCK